MHRQPVVLVVGIERGQSVRQRDALATRKVVQQPAAQVMVVEQTVQIGAQRESVFIQPAVQEVCRAARPGADGASY